MTRNNTNFEIKMYLNFEMSFKWNFKLLRSPYLKVITLNFIEYTIEYATTKYNHDKIYVYFLANYN